VDDGSIMVTGGSDSRLVVWHDRTEEVRISEAAICQTKQLQDQQLQNLLQNEQLLPALKMSIVLERPTTALKIIQSEEYFLQYFIVVLLLFYYNNLIFCSFIQTRSRKRFRNSISKYYQRT